MKLVVLVVLLLMNALIATCGPLRAQTVVLHDSISTMSVAQSASSPLGRDFWFAPVLSPRNTYFALYITSPRAATVFIQYGQQPPQPIAMNAGNAATYNIPSSWILTTSDTIARAAIHLWCDSADLFVSLLATTQFGQAMGGLNLLPAPAWDTDYVLSAGPSSTNSNIGTYGSIFSITANDDSTLVTILPTDNILHVVTYGDWIGHKKGQPFTITLNRGDAALFENQSNIGFTGTSIHSSKPIGIIAGTIANTSPNGSGTPYANCTATLPVRDWGKDYYTGPLGATSVVIIASKDSQTIYRRDHSLGYFAACTIARKDSSAFLEIVDSGSRWESSAPFQITEYTADNLGPAVTLQPIERYRDSIYFNTASSSPLVLVIANSNCKSLTLDGKDIRKMAHSSIDSTHTCYRVTGVADYYTGGHWLASDSAIGAYMTMGTQSYGAYALGTDNGIFSPTTTDIIPPSITIDTQQYCLTARLADSGSGLLGVLFDSATNFSATLDSAFRLWTPQNAITPTYTISQQSGSISMCLIDSLSPAAFSLTAFDRAGNASHISMSYAPDLRLFHPGYTAAVQGLDSCLIGSFETFTVTVTDTSLLSFPVDNVWTDDPAFIFDRTRLAQNALPFTLHSGEPHLLSLRFVPADARSYSANIYLHSPLLATRVLPLVAVGYPWVVGPVDDVAGSSSSGFDCFPNPASNLVTLRMPSGTAEFDLISVLGTHLLRTVWPAAHATQETLDLSAIPNGVYFYRITSGEIIRMGRLIVQK